MQCLCTCTVLGSRALNPPCSNKNTRPTTGAHHDGNQAVVLIPQLAPSHALVILQGRWWGGPGVLKRTSSCPKTGKQAQLLCCPWPPHRLQQQAHPFPLPPAATPPPTPATHLVGGPEGVLAHLVQTAEQRPPGHQLQEHHPPIPLQGRRPGGSGEGEARRPGRQAVLQHAPMCTTGSAAHGAWQPACLPRAPCTDLRNKLLDQEVAHQAGAQHVQESHRHGCTMGAKRSTIGWASWLDRWGRPCGCKAAVLHDHWAMPSCAKPVSACG